MGNRSVTFESALDHVFKALADPTRRRLLDALRRQDGQTLSALHARFAISRIAVMKHLDVLEVAGLVRTERQGRTRVHYLDVKPMRTVHDRWMTKYLEHPISKPSG